MYCVAWPLAVTSVAACVAAVTAAVEDVNHGLERARSRTFMCPLRTWRLSCNLMREVRTSTVLFVFFLLTSTFFCIALIKIIVLQRVSQKHINHTHSKSKKSNSCWKRVGTVCRLLPEDLRLHLGCYGYSSSNMFSGYRLKRALNVIRKILKSLLKQRGSQCKGVQAGVLCLLFL